MVRQFEDFVLYKKRIITKELKILNVKEIKTNERDMDRKRNGDFKRRISS